MAFSLPALAEPLKLRSRHAFELVHSSGTTGIIHCTVVKDGFGRRVLEVDTPDWWCYAAGWSYKGEASVTFPQARREWDNSAPQWAAASAVQVGAGA